MTDDLATLREQSRDWTTLGTFDFKLLPHCPVPIGPRVWLLIRGTPVFCLDARASHLLTPEQARLMANRLKIAADEAEAMARRVERRHRAALVSMTTASTTS